MTPPPWQIIPSSPPLPCIHTKWMAPFTEIYNLLAIGAIQVIVIGGGMAGLAACENLAKSGVKVVLVEANNYLGN